MANPEFLQAVLDTLRDPLVVLDAELRIVTANRSFFRTLRLLKDETVGKSLHEISTPEWDISVLQPELEEVLRGSEEISGLPLATRSRPGKREFVLSARRIDSPGIDRDLLLIALEDATERNASRGAERDYKLLVDAATDYAMILVSASGRIERWNSGAERIFRIPERDALGRDVSLIFRDEDVRMKVHVKELESARSTGRAEDERWMRRGDGTQFFASGVVDVVCGENGEHRGYVKVLRDVTERRLVQEQIEKANERLRLSIAQSNHRLKNTLNAVAAQLEIALRQGRGSIKDELRRLIASIHGYAKLHGVLTAQAVLDDPSAPVLDVKPMLEKQLELIRLSTERVAISSDLEDIRLPAAKCTSLNLVLNEIVGNAIKQESSFVHVALERSDGGLRLSVEDNGRGFGEVQFGERRGSGLAMVRRLVEIDLNGTLSYGNRDAGSGAEVAVKFPDPNQEHSEPGYPDHSSQFQSAPA